MLNRILSLTLAGCIPLVLLLVVEALLPRLWTYRWRYYARLVPLFAFAVPLPLLTFLPRFAPETASLALWAAPVQALYEWSGTLALPAPPPTSALPELAAFLWAAGCCVFSLWRLAAWLRFAAAVRRISCPAGEREAAALAECMLAMNLRRRVSLRLCPGVGAPALVGVLRPVLLLPRLSIPEDELRYIMRHELIHLRRADIIYKLAAQVVNAAHWFNPLAWLLARQVNCLCELSCDEAAVRGLNHSQRKRYGLSILNQIDGAQANIPQSVPALVSAKEILKKRLDVIMNLPKPNKKRAIQAIISAFALCAVGTTAALALAIPVASSSVDTPHAFAITQAEETSAEAAQLSLSGPIPDTAEFRYVTISFGGERNHMGTDIAAPEGSNILAAAGGSVVYAQTGGESPYGNHIILDHGGDYKTLYAHCERLLIKQGDTVKQGQAIATVGATGYATGPHCHFEVRKGTEPVDAEEYVEISNLAPDR